MAKTQLKKLVIEKFRALNNVKVEFGDHITQHGREVFHRNFPFVAVQDFHEA